LPPAAPAGRIQYRAVRLRARLVGVLGLAIQGTSSFVPPIFDDRNLVISAIQTTVIHDFQGNYHDPEAITEY